MLQQSNVTVVPLATGDTAMMLLRAAPVPWPMRVIRSASPPNAGMFSRNQCKPATRSISPKLPCALPRAPVFRKPVVKTRHLLQSTPSKLGRLSPYPYCSVMVRIYSWRPALHKTRFSMLQIASLCLTLWQVTRLRYVRIARAQQTFRYSVAMQAPLEVMVMLWLWQSTVSNTGNG